MNVKSREKSPLLHKNTRINRSSAGNIINLLFIMLVASFMILPLIFCISNAFKPLDEIFMFPPRFFVRNPSIKNMRDLFLLMQGSWVPFSRYISNTLFITTSGTVLHVVFGSLAAYILAKHKFPGRKTIFQIVIITLMFSNVVTQIPNYIIMSKIGWIDTYFAIIIPAIATPLGLFLMKQFMEQIPDSLIESARIDGAGEIRTFWLIAMPSVKPAWITMIIFSFQPLWNTTGGNFIFREELKTLPYALNQIMLGGIARAGVASAATLIIISVPIIMFAFLQSQIIETMATSGIKE